MLLTELKCKKAMATGVEHPLRDGNALTLIVRAKGTKLWRYEFRLSGKKDKFSYGNYPEISLADARLLHAIGRQLVEMGRHPEEVLEHPTAIRMAVAGHGLPEIERAISQEAKRADLANRMTFGAAASRYKEEWVDRRWKNPDKGYSPVRNHLLPTLAQDALEDIDAPKLRELLYLVREKSGVQAALHAHGWASRIYGYALESGWCQVNPAAQIKAARIGEKGKRSRWLTAPEVRRYLVGLYQSDCYRGYKLALHLLLMLGLRKNELCQANWQEFRLEAGEWYIPASRMKNKKEHLVFLPTQAVEILQDLKRLGGGSEWVLPMPTNLLRPMSGNNLDGAHAAAINAAAIDDYVIHDHRHTASTLLRDMGHIPEVVEIALSHTVPGIAGVYAHAEYKKQRLTMLQEWADFLDKTMSEQKVIQATFRRLG